MGRLNLGEIQAGMVLASDVTDRNGRILLKGGLALSDRHLVILKQWGITDADIQGVTREEVAAKVTASLDQAVFAEKETEYRHKFSLTDLSLPFNQELLRLAVLRAVHKSMGVTPGEP